MAIRDILLLGNPKLYEKSIPVQQEELPNLLPQIELMWNSIVDIKKTMVSEELLPHLKLD